MKKFWSWIKRKVLNQGEAEPVEERVLVLSGAIAEESWFDDEVSPAIFKEELNAGTGDIQVWINSPGGDVFAAAQIYNALKEYPGKVTVKVDSLAASAASVIAMAGDVVMMSPVSMMMIHNPSMMTVGDSKELAQAIQALDEVKESILNAYENKTHMSRKALSKLMDNTTWMNAKSAVEYGFADGVMYQNAEEESKDKTVAVAFTPMTVTNSILEKVRKAAHIEPVQDAEPPQQEQPEGVPADRLMERLDLIKNVCHI